MHLVKVLYVHEYKLFALWVEILERTCLHTYIVYLVPGRESVVNGFSCGNTLEFCSHKSRPFPWLHMEKFDDFVNVMVETDT